MGWVEVTLEVDAARAEALSEALLEAGAVSVSLEDAAAGSAAERPRFAEPDWTAAAPWRRNRLRALLEPGTDCQAMVAAAASAAGLAAPPEFVQSRVDDQDWVRATQAQFAPLAVGERLWIVPSWHEPPDPQALAVRLDPGLAFGTGTHPTTRLVLAWLERTLGSPAGEASAGHGARDSAIEERPGDRGRRRSSAAADLRVLDYGCGSGILAIAAAKLGAGEVDAVDIDPQALETTVQNAARNAVAVRAAAPDALPAGNYDVVVANILANPLVVLEPVLARRTRAGASIALSGILATQAAEVIGAYAGDFDIGVNAESQGWVLLAGRRRAAPDAAGER